jgi:GT2 family glycosyltransferase
LRIAVLIPTYNEPDLLARCVESLQESADKLELIAINAGNPLPPELASKVTEIDAPDDAFWTKCMQMGLEHVRKTPPDFLMLSNADTQFAPGTVDALLKVASEERRAVACSAAYFLGGDDPELQYSDQSDWGFLLYGKILKRWAKRSGEPKEPFRMQLTGGQGVLIPFAAMNGVDFAVADLPHYASDHDLWLQLRERCWQLWFAPGAAIFNQRQFSQKRKGSLMKTLWWRMTSDQTPESARIMWNLRRRHLPYPVAAVSFIVSFTLRWTLGLPGIVRRS